MLIDLKMEIVHILQTGERIKFVLPWVLELKSEHPSHFCEK